MSVKNPEAWTGQRLPFYIDVRSPGSFGGATGFDMPQIPGTVILKVGNAFVSTERIEGGDWAVQRHEFALFSQREGPLDIPPIAVRFGSREGFSGIAEEIEAETPVTPVFIKRPPDSENIGFLITTESLELTESWNPEPGSAKVGDIFKRTITQRAPQMTGMALAPAPRKTPDGIRLYPVKSETNDKLQRGEFLGERTETLTYLIEQPGTLSLPALKYVWWNPETETLDSKRLPAVTFEVLAPPVTAQAVGEQDSSRHRIWIVPLILLAAAAAWRLKRIAASARRCWSRLNPPDRIAARRMLRACRHNNAQAAAREWRNWTVHSNSPSKPSPELASELRELHRSLFGPQAPCPWKGQAMYQAFHALLEEINDRMPPSSSSPLPELNPTRPSTV